MRVGFIGLGRIGLPLARKLAEAGHQMWLYDARPEAVVAACENLKAKGADTPAQLAAQVEALVVSVSGPEADLAVLTGPQGAFSGAGRGLLVIDLTTISVAQSQALAQEAAAKGFDYLDAPLSVAQRPDIERHADGHGWGRAGGIRPGPASAGMFEFAGSFRWSKRVGLRA